MQDAELIALFAERNERAIAETNLQYGKSCRSIAAELTRSRQDAEEIVQLRFLRIIDLFRRVTQEQLTRRFVLSVYF